MIASKRVPLFLGDRRVGMVDASLSPEGRVTVHRYAYDSPEAKADVERAIGPPFRYVSAGYADGEMADEVARLRGALDADWFAAKAGECFAKIAADQSGARNKRKA